MTSAFESSVNIEVDARGLSCPLPLLKAKKALNSLAQGQVLRVISTDQGSWRDFQVFAQQSGHRLLDRQNENGIYTYIIKKS